MKTAIFISLAVLQVLYIVTAKPAYDCGGKAADVVFIVDTSNSIWQPDFTMHMLPFVTDVVSRFDIGPSPTQTRVGMVTYGDTLSLQFQLKDFTDKAALTDRIMKTPFPGSYTTQTGAAIEYVAQNMFTSEQGARDNVDHIVIVLTDGESSDTTATRNAAAIAKGRGIMMFAIGVGYDVNSRELADIASEPEDRFAFHVGSFKALASIKHELALSTCSVATKATSTTSTTTTTTTTTTPSTTTEPTTTSTTTTTTTTTEPSTTTTTTRKPTTTTPESPTTTPEVTTTVTEKPHGDQPRAESLGTPDDCESKPADIYFILDVSASLYIKHFTDKVLPFVSDIVGNFDISPDHTRVGIVTFSDDVTPVFELDTYLSRDELKKGIASVVYKGGPQTNTADAIAFVRDIGFSPDVVRKGVTQIVIVITDGQSYNQPLTAFEAMMAKNGGINMFSVGVGPSVDPEEMKAIGSAPEDKFVFHVNDFDALSSLKEALTEQTCNLKGSSPIIDPKDCVIEPTDIMFVFESASKARKSRKILRTVVTDFAEKLKVKSDVVRVGSMTDPCPDEFGLSFQTLADFKRKMETLVYNTKGQMYRLINALRNDKFSPQTTSGRRQVAVLFLDESTSNPEQVANEAEMLKAQGVELYVVAVGTVSEFMMMDSVSEPVDTHIIRLKDYPQLKSVKLNKLWNICADEGNKPSLPSK